MENSLTHKLLHSNSPLLAFRVFNIARSGTTTGFYLYTGKTSVTWDFFTWPGADLSINLRGEPGWNQNGTYSMFF